MITKTCLTCGKVFEAHSNGVKYCSRDCFHKSQHTRKPAICPICKKEFMQYPSEIKRGRFYCSWTCYLKSKEPEKITKVCPVCGKMFTINAKYSDRYTVCSIECRLSTRRYVTCKRCGKIFLDGRKNGTSAGRSYCSEECRRPPVIVSCKTCGKKFRKIPSAVAEHNFCSKSCHLKYNGENMLEKKFRLAFSALGIPFVQECSIGRYSLDFAVVAHKIGLEVDGEYWHQDPEKDRKRDTFLNRHGWVIIRFREWDINNTQDLRGMILNRLQEVINIDEIRRQPTLTDYENRVILSTNK